MSADLFAEFNESSTSPPAPTTAQTPFGPPSTQAQRQSTASEQSNFDFFQSTVGSSTTLSQPSSQWSSFTPQPSAPGSWVGSNPSPAPQPSAPVVADDDDDWGDFETSEPNSVSQNSTYHAPQTSQWASQGQPVQWQNPRPASTAQEPPRARIVRASTMDLMTNSLVSMEAQPKPGPAPSIWEEPEKPNSRPKLKQAPSDPNVLFDAADFELEGGADDLDDDDEDDFGDFETSAPTQGQPQQVTAAATLSTRPAMKPAPPSLDLLGLSIDDPPSQPTPKQPSHTQQASSSGLLSFGATVGTYPNAPKSPSYQQRNPFPELAVKTPTTSEFDRGDKDKTPSPVTAWPSYDTGDAKATEKYHDDDEDEWGAWDDMPAGGDKAANFEKTKEPENWDWDQKDDVQPTPKITDDAPPPVNVPPPSVILSVFPELLGSASKLFKPMAGQSASIKERILSDPKAIDFLTGYILLATTAAHVIAGRKQRWHRDKILAKSMSISAAGSKGMKLAGVDKTQSAREDREAADVVAVWREHVGRLRSAVAAAKTAGKANLKVPELSETMQIQTAKLAPTAAKACIICGMKREERVSKVDHEVEDSFGEWWVEHWGHRACRNFWTEHEQNLRQR